MNKKLEQLMFSGQFQYFQFFQNILKNALQEVSKDL